MATSHTESGQPGDRDQSGPPAKRDLAGDDPFDDSEAEKAVANH